MNKLATLLAAVTLAAGTLAAPASAQTMANRIAAVRDGSVHFSFATRPDVCGYGDEGFSVNRGSGGSTSSMGDGGWRGRPCIHGPMQMELVRSDGETIGVRMCIGCRPRQSSGASVDIGEVSPAEAAHYLVTAARTLSHHNAGQAMAAATAADAVDIGPELIALVKDDNVSTDTRKDAVFWLGQSDAAVDRLIDIAQHDRSVELRTTAMFWLGQSHDPRAVKFFHDILVR